MNWSNVMVIDFLHAYETEPIIWDLRNEDNKKKKLVNDAWRRVHKRFARACTIDDLKKKRDSLMAYYRIHWNKAKKIKLSEEPGAEEYTTNWFAFDTMNSFLGEVYDVDNIFYTAETRPERSNHSKMLEYLESDDSNDLECQPEIPAMEEEPEVLIENNKVRSHSITKERANNTIYKMSNECELYGQLLSQKLLKLNEDDRLVLMNEIDNLVFRTTYRAISKRKGRPSASNISSSSQISPGDALEDNIIQDIKASPSRAQMDPLD